MLVDHAIHNDGRWQEGGVWRLPRKAVTQALIESNVFRGTRQEKMNRWILLRLERLYERIPWPTQGRFLLPGHATKPKLAFREGPRCKGVAYNPLAVMILIRWHAMPEGYYGDPNDPCLAIGAASEFCGCSPTSVYNWESQGRIKHEPHLSRSGKGFVRTWRRSDLQRVRGEREADCGNGEHNSDDGKRFRLGLAARRLGMTEERLRRMLTNETFGSLGELGAATVRPAKNSKPCVTISERGIASIKAKMAEQGKPEGYDDYKGLAALFCLKSARERAELGECLVGWREAGLIDYQTVPIEVETARVPQWHRTIAYPTTRARELWEADYVTVGVKALKALLANGPLTTTEVHAAMARLGICSRGRWGQIKRRAGVVLRRKGNNRITNQYELRGQRIPENPADILRSLLADGPVKSKVIFEQARRRNLAHKEIWEASKALEVIKERGAPGGARGGRGFSPWQWRLPPEQLPAARSPPTTTPALDRTWQIYEFCYFWYVVKDKSRRIVMKKANAEFGLGTVKEEAIVRQNAYRYAKKFNKPKKNAKEHGKPKKTSNLH
jgi:hypothetical protein